MAIIDKSTDYFRIKLYTGNNNAQTIAWDETDTNMKPDMLWIKSYAGNTVFEHVLGNVVSGGGKYLVPNSTAAEASNGNVINTFNTNGFSVGGATQVSESSRSYVAWGWKASNTTASNTAGDINSTVSVNTTPGFSVVSWTANGSNNATIGHGLSSTPKIVLYKKLSDTDSWYALYTFVDGTQDYLVLNSTNAKADLASGTYGTATSTTISNIGFPNSNSVIAYCFAEKRSFSKFGSYTGNANNDGPFIYTGFSPAFVMFKDTENAGDWTIQDSARDTFNLADARLYANLTNAQNDGGGLGVDFLSNGIKIRTSSVGWNRSNTKYIYMAFAENPFVTSTDNGSIPATAR